MYLMQLYDMYQSIKGDEKLATFWFEKCGQKAGEQGREGGGKGKGEGGGEESRSLHSISTPPNQPTTSQENPFLWFLL